MGNLNQSDQFIEISPGARYIITEATALRIIADQINSYPLGQLYIDLSTIAERLERTAVYIQTDEYPEPR